MKYLIINADDFGLSASVNDGIIRAWEAGGITNATLMLKREAAGEAIRFAKENPSFPVGLHLDLDELLGQGVEGKERFSMTRIATLLKDDVFFREIEADIEYQIKDFKDTGLGLSHLDGHHHLHALPQLFPLVVDKMLKHGIKTIRFSQKFDLLKYPAIEWDDGFFAEMKALLKRHYIKYTDHFINGWQPYDLHLLKDGVTELMTHPGTTEEWRIEELKTLTSPEWKKGLKEEGVILSSFRDLAEGGRA
jgi:predicted glycoside hydrolase/deacetylase ChbG (UPF0249 family)